MLHRVEKERNATAQELEEAQMSLQQDQVEKAGLEKNGKMVGHQARCHSTHFLNTI